MLDCSFYAPVEKAGCIMLWCWHLSIRHLSAIGLPGQSPGRAIVLLSASASALATAASALAKC